MIIVTMIIMIPITILVAIIIVLIPEEHHTIFHMQDIFLSLS